MVKREKREKKGKKGSSFKPTVTQATQRLATKLVISVVSEEIFSTDKQDKKKDISNVNPGF